MAALDRALVRSLMVSTNISSTRNNNSNNRRSREQIYEPTQSFDDTHDDYRSKSLIDRSRLLRPMSRLFSKAHAATVGKRTATSHRHSNNHNNSNSRPSITTLFDTPTSITTDHSYTSELIANHHHHHHHLSNSSDHVLVTSALTSPMETPCDDTIAVTRSNICASPEQTALDLELLESDSSSLSIHSVELLSSPISLSSIPRDEDSISTQNQSSELANNMLSSHIQGNNSSNNLERDTDRHSVYSAHTAAICTHHPYAENRQRIPIWQQSAQQLPLTSSNNNSNSNIMEDELVSTNTTERHGRRSLGKRAWHGLRQQIARALPHLSRSRFNTDHHLDVDYESRFNMVRERSRTMPSIATTNRTMATTTDLLVRRRRHMSDTANATTAAELLRPPPYIKGALHPFAWAPNRTSFTISVTVSRHTSPCGSGDATPDPRSRVTYVGVNSSISTTPWDSTSNLRPSLEDNNNNNQHCYSTANDSQLSLNPVVVERVPGIIGADGRTFPLPPSSLKPRKPFKHAPVAAPACRAPEISTVPQRTQRQRQQPRTRERSSSASASSYTTTVPPALAAIRAGAYRNSSSRIELPLNTTTTATTSPSSPVLDSVNRHSCSTSSQHDMVVDIHGQVNALLHFSQALGHAILEIQDSLVLWEQSATVRELARRHEVYLYTHWPESIRRQMAENASAHNSDAQRPAITNSGVGSDFAPGPLITNHRRTSSSHAVSPSGSTNTSNDNTSSGDVSTHNVAMNREPLLPLLPDVVRQLVIQADQALLRAHTSKARALLKQAVDPLSDQVALAKTLMASVDARDDSDESTSILSG